MVVGVGVLVCVCVWRARRDTVMPPAVAKRSCRLIVRNLPFSATVPSLLDVFGKYGPVLELSIPEKPSEGGEVPKVCVCHGCRVSFGRRETWEIFCAHAWVGTGVSGAEGAFATVRARGTRYRSRVRMEMGAALLVRRGV